MFRISTTRRLPLAVLLGALAISAFAFTLNPAGGTRILLKIVQGEVCKKDSKLMKAHAYDRLYDPDVDPTKKGRPSSYTSPSLPGP